MYYFVRTATIGQGMEMPAVEFAALVSEHINKTYPGHSIQVLRNVGGAQDKLHWFGTYESLDATENLMAQLLEDEEYGTMVADATEAGLFTLIEDSYFRVAF
jgi:hypothetical protein